MKNTLGYIYLCIAWGTSWVAIKFCNQSFSPLFGASLRFWLGGSVLLILAFFSGRLQALRRKDMSLLLWTGLLTFNIGYGIVYITELYVDSAVVATIFGTFPIWVAFLGHFMVPDETLGGKGFAGVMAGFLGVVVLSLPTTKITGGEEILWLFLMVLSPAACALNAILVKNRGKHLNSYTLNIIPMLLGGAGLSMLSFMFEKERILEVTTSGVISLFYLVLIVTIIIFTLYYWLLKRIPLVLLSSTAYVSLIIAVISGWMVLGESITYRKISGVALILFGVYLVQRDQRGEAERT